MPILFTEDTYEQAIIELFENMGYDHLYAPDLDRDYSSPLLDAVLRDSLVRINRGLPVEAIDEALLKLKTFDTGSLLQKNIIFMDYLQNGITVKLFVKGEEQSSIVRLIDYENEKKNSFYVVNQFTFLENGNNRRPDGLYAFYRRQIGDYLIMRMHFVFYDYEKGIFPFLLDYLAVMILIVFIGYYGGLFLKKTGKKKRKGSY